MGPNMTFKVYLLLLGSAHAVFLPNASSSFNNTYRPRIDVKSPFLIGPLGPNGGPSGVGTLQPLSSFVTSASPVSVPKFGSGSSFPLATTTSTPSSQNVTQSVVPAKSSGVDLPSSVSGSVDGSRSALPQETGNTRSKDEFPSAQSIPTSTSTQPLGIILPVTTSVQKPKATDDGSIIPCHMWFFDLCLHWEDFNILGWKFNLPPGVHPPGPPPAIKFDPSLSISVDVKGKLPDWPEVTIGNDRVPTFKSEPKCETTSAEMCLTRTSYGVSSTHTTDTKVLSTCATVHGCHVEGSSSTQTTTKTCTTCTSCYKWLYDDKDVDLEAAVGDVVGDALDGRPAPAARREKRRTPRTISASNGYPTDSADSIPVVTSPPASRGGMLQKRVRTENRVSSRFGGCDLNAKMIMKDYPFVAEFVQYPAASSYFLVTSKDPVNGICQAATMYSTDNWHGATIAAGGPIYKLDKGSAPVINTDHVYELQFLGAFFAHALSLNGAPTCQQFNDMFVDTGLLQDLFYKLPNEVYPDFAAMDRYINLKKANYLQVGGNAQNVAPGEFNTMIQNLQDFGLAANFMSMPEIIGLFRKTHERLYQELQAWDAKLQGCNVPGGAATWAASYSVWMTDLLTARAAVYTNAAAGWYQTLDNAVAAHSNVPPYQFIRQTYPVASYSIPIAAMGENLAAAPGPGAGPVKRSAICTMPTQSSKSEPSSKTKTSPKPKTSTAVVLPKIVPTSSDTITKASPPAPNVSPDVLSIDIYTDNSCLNVLNTTELVNFGDCYSPKDSKGKAINFACFALTNIPQGVMARGSVTAFKKANCESKSASDRKEYLVPNHIQYDNERPFKMGSLQLNTRQV